MWKLQKKIGGARANCYNIGKKGGSMKIIVCVDERGGLSFAKKRHATDCLLREDMLKTCQNNTLWMDAYSYQQFETDFQSRIALTENYQTPIPEQD